MAQPKTPEWHLDAIEALVSWWRERGNQKSGIEDHVKQLRKIVKEMKDDQSKSQKENKQKEDSIPQ